MRRRQNSAQDRQNNVQDRQDSVQDRQDSVQGRQDNVQKRENIEEKPQVQTEMPYFAAYKSAYGDAAGTSTLGGSHQLAVPVVRFNEFLKDTQRIGRGVVVLAPGWEQALENNKQAYAGEFVATSRFISAFPTTMTPAQFVDKLNQNAGSVLSVNERTTAINLFSGAADSSNTTARAQALRQVAEDSDLFSAEFNRAFVLTEFFGYLRRNPNDLPDSDYTGYDFWLTKLNQFNGDDIGAEMVKAFIASSEYRQRCGP